MNADEDVEFIQRLNGLAELFEAPLTPTKKTLYWNALKDIPLVRVMAAIDAAVKACTWFPKPAELRKLAIGDDEDRVEAAWLQWKSAARIAGGWASVIVPDPVLAETLLSMWGNWPAACRAEYSEEMWAAKRKEFGRVYHSLARRGDLVGPRYLRGEAEATNLRGGHGLKFCPVYELGGREVRELPPAQADEARMLLAAHSAGLKQLEGELSQ